VLTDAGRGDIFTLSTRIVQFTNKIRSGQRGVINLSLGVERSTSDNREERLTDGVMVLEIALAVAFSRSIPIVAAVGNESWGRLVPYNAQFPASLDFVISVQASDLGGSRACFSNLGGTGPERYAAPGCGVISLVSPTDFGYSSGTSFAAPLIAGMKALNPALGAIRLRSSSDPTLNHNIAYL
jgi:subtilisin family serine protease